VVNKPTRGLGSVTVDRLIETSASEGKNLLETAKTAGGLSSKAQKGLEAFIKVIEDGKAILEHPLVETTVKKKSKRKKEEDAEMLRAGEGLSVCVAQMLKDSGIAEYHLLEDEIMGNQRLTNMQELVNAASLYAGTVEGLLEFLEHIELDRSLEDVSLSGKSSQSDGTVQSGSENKVTLITFHNTKGLEFRKVIMTGLEQGIFPREDKKNEELEEERRLFYVGATRAMDELYLCSCAERRMFGRTMSAEPSMFLREIDKSCLRIVGSAPYSFRAEKSHPWDRALSGAEKKSGWQRGQRLFHDDYGYGIVMKAKDDNNEPVVRVQFETGQELQFSGMEKRTDFVKIGDDD
jgi:DNA helicase-2/ATP-dependent DNA helicase PcrA